MGGSNRGLDRAAHFAGRDLVGPKGDKPRRWVLPSRRGTDRVPIRASGPARRIDRQPPHAVGMQDDRGAPERVHRMYVEAVINRVHATRVRVILYEFLGGPYQSCITDGAGKQVAATAGHGHPSAPRDGAVRASHPLLFDLARPALPRARSAPSQISRPLRTATTPCLRPGDRRNGR